MEKKWVMVPIDATPEMLDAGRDDCLSEGDAVAEWTMQRAWQSMLLAAPHHELDEGALQRAYWLGWRNSAAWADRKDLWADRDSRAYTQERDDDLGSLAAAIKQATHNKTALTRTAK